MWPGCASPHRRHDEVSELLQSPDTPSRDINKLSKELGRLTVGVELYDRYCEVMEGARELVDMIEASDATTEARHALLAARHARCGDASDTPSDSRPSRYVLVCCCLCGFVGFRTGARCLPWLVRNCRS